MDALQTLLADVWVILQFVQAVTGVDIPTPGFTFYEDGTFSLDRK